MKNFTQKLVLLLCSITFSLSAWSQQSISLTWQAEASVEKKIEVRATAGTDNITVDWGNGNVDTYSGQGNYYDITLTHNYTTPGAYNVNITATSGTDLTELHCYQNQLTALDVSKNTALTELSCSDNQLTVLDLSKNTAISTLYCSDNQLTDLDLSKNTALTFLHCSYNQLTDLDLSKNTNLTTLICSDNQLTDLDLSKNTALTYLNCNFNQLTYLDLSKNTNLNHLSCYYNKLTTLDLSKNTNLTYLHCTYNQLTTLDLSKNTNLTILSCDNNQLTALDLSKNTDLGNLDCASNQLTALDLSKNTNLKSFNCANNQLTALDLSKNTNLTSLRCNNNQLTDLDLSKNTALTYLYCYGNCIPLSDLYKLSQQAIANAYLGTQNLSSEKVDLNKSINITPTLMLNGINTVFAVNKLGETAVAGADYTLSGGSIVFHTDGIYTIEMTNATIISDQSYPAKIVNAYIAGNVANQQITFTWLGTTNKKSFSVISFVKKSFTVDWGDGIVETFNGTGKDANMQLSHTYNDDNEYTVIITGDSPECLITSLTLSSIQLTSLDVSKNTALTRLTCADNRLTNLDLSKNTDITLLWCHSNQLTALNVSKNMNLTSLICVENQLTDLDVSENTNLTSLRCNNNQLTALDVSKNTDLTYLYCGNNQLSDLDLSNNTDLKSLECNNNQLTDLNLSENTALTRLYCSDNAIPLAALKAISDRNIQTCVLGTQTLVLQAVGKSAIIDSVFYGAGTSFVVSINNNPATEGIDYSISNGRITFLNEGIFTIEISNPALVSNPDTPTKVIATFRYFAGIDEHNEQQLLVYPNPVIDRFIVKATQGAIEHLQLYDMSGRLRYEALPHSETVEVDISDYPAGIYVIKVGTYIVKVIKN